MSGSLTVIFNPRAGRGGAARARSRIEAAFRSAGGDCRIVTTAGPGHAAEVAGALAETGERRVAIAGGDGTFAEALQGLAGTSTEAALLPVGSSNDLARSLGVPRHDLAASVRVALSGRARPLDLGRTAHHYFATQAGAGFPAEVAQLADRTRWLPGPAAFFYAILRCLLHLRPTEVTLDLDGERRTLACTFVLAMNLPFTGGGLELAPGASPFDGRLDVVIVGPASRLDLARSFPRAYRGAHLTHPAFSLVRAARVEIASERPMPALFDGEPHEATPLVASAVPGALQMVLPADSPLAQAAPGRRRPRSTSPRPTAD